MEVIQCGAIDCDGVVIWNEELERFICNKCGAIHEED